METIDLPKQSTILIDTNFFIDLFEHEKNYIRFFESVKSAEVSLVSSDLVKVEFIRTKVNAKFLDKTKLFSEIVTFTLPIDRQTSELLLSTLEEYGSQIEGVEITDLFLATLLKRYKGLYLLTRNHKDFPTRIFGRSHIFSIEHEREVKTYALYRYPPEKNAVTINEELPF